MKPEELKIIAEGMGKIIAVSFDFIPDEDSIYLGACSHTYLGATCFKYNPIENAAQCMEIMEKLIQEANYSIFAGFDKSTRVMLGMKIKGTGKTINEAVCRAALEYFKGENNE